MKRLSLLAMGCISSVVSAQSGAPGDHGKTDTKKEVAAVLDFKMQDIEGKEVNLADYQGSVLMIVNVASRCGLTPQYKELEALYREHKEAGFTILAFPANNFGKQEPGTNKEIKQFCESKFDVSFDLFAKVSVKGDDKCPLYGFLTDTDKNGELGGEIRWNFTKFIVDRQGQLVARIEPRIKPTDQRVTELLKKSLNGQKIDRTVISGS